LIHLFNSIDIERMFKLQHLSSEWDLEVLVTFGTANHFLKLVIYSFLVSCCIMQFLKYHYVELVKSYKM